jgi:hypothetical protein
VLLGPLASWRVGVESMEIVFVFLRLNEDFKKFACVEAALAITLQSNQFDIVATHGFVARLLWAGVSWIAAWDWQGDDGDQRLNNVDLTK